MRFKTITGLYIHGRGIQAASFRLSGKVPTLIKQAGIDEIPAPDALPHILHTLFKENKLPSSHVVICLDLPSLFTKEIPIHLEQAHLIKSTLPYELENHIPYDIDSIIYGYFIGPKKDEDTHNVFICTLKKDDVETFQTVFKKAHIKQVGLNIKPVALANYYTFISEDFKMNCVLLLDLDSQGTVSIAIVDNGCLRFAKTTDVTLPTTLPTDDYIDEGWNALYTEGKDAMSYFQTIQRGERPTKIYLHHTHPILDDIKAFIVSKFSLQNIRAEHPINPTAIIPMGTVLPFYEKGYPMRFDKADHPPIPMPTHQKRHRPFVLLGIMILCLFILSSEEIWLRLKTNKLAHYIAMHREASTHVKNMQETIENLEEVYTIVEESLTREGNILDIMSELWTTIPKDTIIHRLRLHRDGLISITGQTKDLNGLIQSLNNNAHIEKVILIDKRHVKKIHGKELNIFKMDCYFSAFKQ